MAGTSHLDLWLRNTCLSTCCSCWSKNIQHNIRNPIKYVWTLLYLYSWPSWTRSSSSTSSSSRHPTLSAGVASSSSESSLHPLFGMFATPPVSTNVWMWCAFVCQVHWYLSLCGNIKCLLCPWPLSGSIMPTWQTRSANELAHNAGCLGRYALSCLFMFLTSSVN